MRTNSSLFLLYSSFWLYCIPRKQGLFWVLKLIKNSACPFYIICKCYVLNTVAMKHDRLRTLSPNPEKYTSRDGGKFFIKIFFPKENPVSKESKYSIDKFHCTPKTAQDGQYLAIWAGIPCTGKSSWCRPFSFFDLSVEIANSRATYEGDCVM